MPFPQHGNLVDKQRWHAARDALACRCGHPNASHGFGHDAEPLDGSRLGLGACGRCDCLAFASKTEREQRVDTIADDLAKLEASRAFKREMKRP